MELEPAPLSLAASSSTAWRWCASGPRSAGSTLELRGRAGPRRRVGPTSCGSSRSSSTCSRTPSSSTPTAARSRSRPRRAAARSQSTVSDTGIGIAAAGAGADLRGLPARRARRAHERRGHRARPHPVAPHRRAARRAAVAGERRRAREHVRFTIPLGARRDAARRRRAGRRMPRPPAAVLVVEDDAPLGRPAARLPGGRRAAPCGSPATARRASSSPDRCSPAAVVLDVLLPRLDGWDVLAHLKADPAMAGDPGRHRLDARRARQGVRARRRGVPGQAGGARGGARRAAPLRGARRARGARSWSSTTTRVDLDLVEATLAPRGLQRPAAGERRATAWSWCGASSPRWSSLDLLMPGVDGFAVVERLRADPATAASRSSC